MDVAAFFKNLKNILCTDLKKQNSIRITKENHLIWRPGEAVT